MGMICTDNGREETFFQRFLLDSLKITLGARFFIHNNIISSYFILFCFENRVLKNALRNQISSGLFSLSSFVFCNSSCLCFY